MPTGEQLVFGEKLEILSQAMARAIENPRFGGITNEMVEVVALIMLRSDVDEPRKTLKKLYSCIKKHGAQIEVYQSLMRGKRRRGFAAVRDELWPKGENLPLTP